MSGRADEIEREIEEARAGMSRVAAEIERRLQPETLVESAIGLFQRNSQARAIVDEVTDLAVRNPVPLLLIGLGVAWLAYDFSRNRPAPARRPATGDEPDGDYHTAHATPHTDRPAPAAERTGTTPPTADTLLGRVPGRESAAMAAHVFADAGMDGRSPPRGA